MFIFFIHMIFPLERQYILHTTLLLQTGQTTPGKNIKPRDLFRSFQRQNISFSKCNCFHFKYFISMKTSAGSHFLLVEISTQQKGLLSVLHPQTGSVLKVDCDCCGCPSFKVLHALSCPQQIPSVQSSSFLPCLLTHCWLSIMISEW